MRPSAAANWPAIARAVGWEQALGDRMARRPATAALYEFLRFGIKQGWACLFGGSMVGLMIATRFVYPQHCWLARYDFLFLAALTIQALLLTFRMETWEEARVILIYHVIGTAMELFKTSVGSWIYPEPCFFHIAGVPLFSGFMYASIGSYIARSWRLMDFRFTRHPSNAALVALSAAIYVNFFSHHYLPDMRWLLFAAAALIFGRTRIYYRVWHRDRWMPLALGLFLVAFFVWLAENAGTFTHVWLYPHQLHGWMLVRLAKLGSWLLLLIVSYTLVALVNKPTEWVGEADEAVIEPPLDAAPAAPYIPSA
jgi:uncharacterized membrane protein YoaT (DUF817 family)